MSIPMRFGFARIAFVAAMLASGPVHALKMLTEENPPLNYTENGRLTGASLEAVTEMGKRAKVPMSFEALVWEKAYLRAQSESDTCLFSTARQDNRERLFRWVGPIGYQRWAIYAAGDFKDPVKSLQELTKYRVGAVKFDAKVEYLMQSGVTDIRDVGDDALNPPRLMLPKSDPAHIDLWITGAHSAQQVAEKAGVKNLKLVWTVSDAPTWLACNRGVPQATVDALQRAADALVKDGTLKRLTQKYGTAPKR